VIKGVAAGFNAPISGIFFALEVIQGTFVSIEQKKKDDDNEIATSTDAGNLISTKGGISSIVLSAVVAALVSKSILGDELVFKVAKYSLKAPLLELPLYLFLGSVCGVLSFVFSLLSVYCKKFFDGELGPNVLRKFMSAIPAWLKPVIGGLFCGVLGIFYPQILFFGYETLNNLLTKTALTFELLLKLLAVKMVATAVASGSGE
jgi:H+/Cl- antiporter ClcA